MDYMAIVDTYNAVFITFVQVYDSLRNQAFYWSLGLSSIVIGSNLNDQFL